MSKLIWRGKEAIARIKAATGRGLEAAAVVVEAEAKGNIVAKDIIDTGNLLGSMTHEVDGDTARVGTSVEYAVYQEFGTVKMSARPYLRPAVDEHKPEIRKAFADEIRRAL